MKKLLGFSVLSLLLSACSSGGSYESKSAEDWAYDAIYYEELYNLTESDYEEAASCVYAAYDLYEAQNCFYY